MLSHITIGTSRLEEAVAYYDAVLGTLGIERAAYDSQYRYARYHRPGEAFSLFVCAPFDGKPASAGNGTHVAILAADAASVDAFHAAALGAGGTDEGAPGARPYYHSRYYGAYVRDLDGNKLQAVFHDYDPPIG